MPKQEETPHKIQSEQFVPTKQFSVREIDKTNSSFQTPLEIYLKRLKISDNKPSLTNNQIDYIVSQIKSHLSKTLNAHTIKLELISSTQFKIIIPVQTAKKLEFTNHEYTIDISMDS